MLYDRDYRKLSEEEKIAWQKAEDVLNKSKVKNDGAVFIKDYSSYYKLLSDEALHHKQLFPNNFLNTRHLKEKEKLMAIVWEFKELLENVSTERNILNFIKNKKAYFIIASVLKGFHYTFGHHNAFAFNEFALPPNHVVDYLLVGRNSGGYEFIFVELENPSGQITNADGEFGTTIRKGIKQINDWDSWLESNFGSLRLVFDKHLGTSELLPKEFYELDKSRLHYVVIAGRRTDFSKKTYQAKRKLLKSNNILLLHYDNLFDSINDLLAAGNY